MSDHRQFPEGLLGKKLGMTQIFNDQGESIPVTAIEVGPCYVLEVRTQGKHGYNAVQLGFEPKKIQRVDKAQTGHFAKAGKGAFYHVKEVRCDIEGLGWTEPGRELKVADVFNEGELVDVSGTSVGRGFQGVVRRHHMKGQPSTRGTHEVRRHVGAVGCRKTPGRIIKGKRMPGHMGNAAVTIQNLEVIKVRPDQNVIMVRGGVPGAKGGLLVVRKAIKGFSGQMRKPKAA
jgi:large subunit ribosomal protein L3